jgi:protein-tyrosine-phosphatase
MSNIKKILVICTGNICRSPMAEGFLKKGLKSKDGFEVISCGTSAIDGLHPTKEAIQAMEEEGIDISHYISRPFSNYIAGSADIILVMSQAHKDFILHAIPGLKAKVFLYNEFAGITCKGNDIMDPIGQPLSTYRIVLDQIKQATVAIINRIRSGL